MKALVEGKDRERNDELSCMIPLLIEGDLHPSLQKKRERSISRDDFYRKVYRDIEIGLDPAIHPSLCFLSCLFFFSFFFTHSFFAAPKTFCRGGRGRGRKENFGKSRRKIGIEVDFLSSSSVRWRVDYLTSGFFFLVEIKIETISVLF